MVGLAMAPLSDGMALALRLHGAMVNPAPPWFGGARWTMVG